MVRLEGLETLKKNQVTSILCILTIFLYIFRDCMKLLMLSITRMT
jgi:hypothetical protein